MRRLLTHAAVAFVFAVSFVSRADALTIRDVIELSKAGVSDQVLLALIQVDDRVYTLDADAVRQMKDAGVSDAVMLALIHAGREAAQAAAAPGAEAEAWTTGAASTPPAAPPPQVVVIDHTDTQPAVREIPVPVPVAVPVAVPYGSFDRRSQSISTIVTTESGAAVRARVPVPPNCTKVEPIYWGNGGKRRPGTWAPPPQVVCR